jgi:hypothetical protein
MHRTLITSLSLLVACAGPAAADPVRLAAHRAVYDLSLVKGGGARGVDAATGRIVIEFTGDPCEGYASKYRQVTVLESAETGAKTSDMRNATFEDDAGTSFRFKTESLSNGRTEAVDGDAARAANGAVTVRLKQPAPERLQLPQGTLFPTAHMKRLVEAARAGETTVEAKVYDGSEDGRKAYDTLAVVGRRIEPGAKDAAPGAPLEALAKLPRWPVTLSYFAPGRGESTPIYTLAFELYEDGVSRDLRLDYGGFALKGDLTSLEMLPHSGCQR